MHSTVTVLEVLLSVVRGTNVGSVLITTPEFLMTSTPFCGNSGWFYQKKCPTLPCSRSRNSFHAILLTTVWVRYYNHDNLQAGPQVHCQPGANHPYSKYVQLYGAMFIDLSISFTLKL